MTTRHPEKVNNPVSPIKKKPNWIRTKIVNTKMCPTNGTLIIIGARAAALSPKSPAVHAPVKPE